MILVPAWGAYGEMNTILMRTRAYENGVWAAFVHPNRVLIIDPGGKIVAQDDPDAGEQVVTARITIDPKTRRGPIRHRRPEIYGEILRR
jgi:predicted amidohydrolase